MKTPDRIRALTKLVEASTKILTAPVVTTNANKPPLEATTPSERASPTQARKKSNATPTNVPFDPTIEGESAHYVTLMITPVIDDSRKIDSVICQNYNVNLVVRDSLAALHKFVYRKYVKQWEELRKLKPGERPVLSHWLVTVGNPKTSGHTLRVEDTESWRAVEALLRQIEKDGGHDRKYAHKINIDAVYKTHDRLVTPPPVPAKATEKARPQTARVIDLDETPNSVDFVDLEGSGDDDLDLPPIYRGPTGQRASATSRQLNQKRSRDQSLPATQLRREQLYSLTRCTRDGCSNIIGKGTGNCFHLLSKDTHHKLTASDLDEWARWVGVDEVTLKVPPAHWIMAFHAGEKQCENKRKSRQTKDEKEEKREESPVPVPAAAQAVVSQPPPQNSHQLLQQPFQQPLQQPQYWGPPQYLQPPYYYQQPPPHHARLPYYDPFYDNTPHRGYQPRPPPVASSPIRDPIDEQYKGLVEFMLSKGEGDDEDQERVRYGLSVMKEKRISLDTLIHEDWVPNLLNKEGLPLGIGFTMRDLARGFKAQHKAHRDAAQGLTSMGRSAY